MMLFEKGHFYNSIPLKTSIKPHMVIFLNLLKGPFSSPPPV